MNGMNGWQRELEDLRKINKNFWDAVGDRVLPWRIYHKQKLMKAQDLLDYRKKLLITRKDREKQGIVLGGQPPADEGNNDSSAAAGGTKKGALVVRAASAAVAARPTKKQSVGTG